jgi:hypothetical protein
VSPPRAKSVVTLPDLLKVVSSEPLALYRTSVNFATGPFFPKPPSTYLPSGCTINERGRFEVPLPPGWIATTPLQPKSSWVPGQVAVAFGFGLKVWSSEPSAL